MTIDKLTKQRFKEAVAIARMQVLADIPYTRPLVDNLLIELGKPAGGLADLYLMRLTVDQTFVQQNTRHVVRRVVEHELRHYIAQQHKVAYVKIPGHDPESKLDVELEFKSKKYAASITCDEDGQEPCIVSLDAWVPYADPASAGKPGEWLGLDYFAVPEGLSAAIWSAYDKARSPNHQC